MIPTGVQVFVALEPVDMRYGFERLAGLVRERIGYEARSGALFVFVGKRGVSAKALFFDGSGMCIFHKKLDRGTFVMPAALAADMRHIEVDESTLNTLLDGLPIGPIAEPSRARRRRLH